MKSVEFCYWLQGMFELENPKELSVKQTNQIKNHLAMVFKHEIDPSYENAAELTRIHNQFRKDKGNSDDYRPMGGDELIRC